MEHQVKEVKISTIQHCI